MELIQNLRSIAKEDKSLIAVTAVSLLLFLLLIRSLAYSEPRDKYNKNNKSNENVCLRCS